MGSLTGPRGFIIPQDYGYVVLAATSTVILQLYHSFGVVSKMRYRTKVKYPTYMADSTMIANASSQAEKDNLYLYNCAQRASANYNENQPSALAMIMLAGLRMPKATAVVGALWVVNRILYVQGYVRPAEKGNKDGNGRLIGTGWALAHFALLGMSAYTGVAMVMGW